MKIDRLISIIMTLLERRRTSAKYLADMFDVSLRTIYRDVEAINAAGIPVVSSPGVGGGFHIMEGYKVDKSLFTDSDIATLLMGLGSISSTFNTAEITNALSKVKSLIPECKSNDFALKSNQIMVDLQPWMGNTSIQEHIKLINHAISNKNIMSFSYIDKEGKSSSRSIEPHRLILKDNNWYLHGFCLGREAFRIFKVSRMNNIANENKSFVVREVPDSISIFTERMRHTQYDIKIIIHKSIVDRVLNYCSGDNLKEYSPHHYLVHMSFVADDIGYGILLSFGDKCECLEPEYIRNEVARRSLKIAQMHMSSANE